MSTGYPDGQKITQWIGALIAQATGAAIGAGQIVIGPTRLSSWASVIVAVKATGGPVTITVTQQVPSGPAGLLLTQQAVVPAGQTVFESFVLFGATVTITLQGAVGGTTVDYAVTPSNTTTNAQVLASAVINLQHNDALVAAEATLDFMDAAGVMNFTMVDDAPGTRVKVTPAWAAVLSHPGTVQAATGLGGQTAIGAVGPSSAAAIVFGSAGDAAIWRVAANGWETNSFGTFTVAPGAAAIATRRTGDAGYRFYIGVDGAMNWGLAAGSYDLNLYRGLDPAAGTNPVVTTDQGLYVKGTAGTSANDSEVFVTFNTAGVRRVLLGPADSAGAGFRTLRTVN